MLVDDGALGIRCFWAARTGQTGDEASAGMTGFRHIRVPRSAGSAPCRPALGRSRASVIAGRRTRAAGCNFNAARRSSAWRHAGLPATVLFPVEGEAPGGCELSSWHSAWKRHVGVLDLRSGCSPLRSWQAKTTQSGQTAWRSPFLGRKPVVELLVREAYLVKPTGAGRRSDRGMISLLPNAPGADETTSYSEHRHRLMAGPRSDDVNIRLSPPEDPFQVRGSRGMADRRPRPRSWAAAADQFRIDFLQIAHLAFMA